jgi:hypothetical protein
VVADNPIADDGWSNRGTFAGDAEAFMAAKRAGVGLGLEEEPADPGKPVVARLSLSLFWNRRRSDCFRYRCRAGENAKK